MSVYASVYRAIYDQPVLSSVFAQTFGVNQYAIPAIGEAFTQVNDEGEKIAADKGGVTDLWNFHWAGVILRDGRDSHVGAHPLTLRIRTVPMAGVGGKSKAGGKSKLQAILENAKKL